MWNLIFTFLLNFAILYQTLQHFTQFYIFENITILTKVFFLHFTYHFLQTISVHNFTNLDNVAQLSCTTLYNMLHIFTTLSKIQNFTALYIAWQHFPNLKNPANLTILYKSLQNYTYNTLQNFTKLYNIVQNSWHIFQTVPQRCTTLQYLCNTLQYFTNLSHRFIIISQNSTNNLHNSTTNYTKRYTTI